MTISLNADETCLIPRTDPAAAVICVNTGLILAHRGVCSRAETQAKLGSQLTYHRRRNLSTCATRGTVMCGCAILWETEDSIPDQSGTGSSRTLDRIATNKDSVENAACHG